MIMLRPATGQVAGLACTHSSDVPWCAPERDGQPARCPFLLRKLASEHHQPKCCTRSRPVPVLSSRHEHVFHLSRSTDLLETVASTQRSTQLMGWSMSPRQRTISTTRAPGGGRAPAAAWRCRRAARPAWQPRACAPCPRRRAARPSAPPPRLPRTAHLTPTALGVHSSRRIQRLPSFHTPWTRHEGLPGGPFLAKECLWGNP